MFDRYTERARRVIFFAHYEASQFGADRIESEHLLLGLLREDRFLFRPLMPPNWTVESIRRKIEFGAPVRAMVSTSVDMPISSEVKNIFTYAAEEADSMGNSHIETKHLLLGMLREKDCVAAKLLQEDGVQLPAARSIIAGAHVVTEGGAGFAMGSGGGRKPFRGRTIEFLNEADKKVLAITPGAPVPQIGSEIVLGELRARVNRVIYEYEKASAGMETAEEGDPFWLRKILAYVQVTA